MYIRKGPLVVNFSQSLQHLYTSGDIEDLHVGCQQIDGMSIQWPNIVKINASVGSSGGKRNLCWAHMLDDCMHCACVAVLLEHTYFTNK
jgi:hypothetical protein